MLPVAVLAVLYYFVCISESRVYCQDMNSGSWKQLGQSCPINCDNVVSAVERLKMQEYKTYFLNVNKNDTAVNKKLDLKLNKTQINPPSYLLATYERALRSGILSKLVDEIKMAANSDFSRVYSQNGTCSFLAKKFKLKPSLLLKRILENKCRRRRSYNGKEFLDIFTRNLNQFVKTEYEFTEGMITQLFQKLLGKDMDLRHSESDVSSVLDYMSHAVQRYSHSHSQSQRADGSQTLVLISRDCVNVHVPGCYCKRGYVEKEGQCVKPKACLSDYTKENRKYLNMIRLQ